MILHLYLLSKNTVDKNITWFAYTCFCLRKSHTSESGQADFPPIEKKYTGCGLFADGLESRGLEEGCKKAEKSRMAICIHTAKREIAPRFVQCHDTKDKTRQEADYTLHCATFMWEVPDDIIWIYNLFVQSKCRVLKIDPAAGLPLPICLFSSTLHLIWWNRFWIGRSKNRIRNRALPDGHPFCMPQRCTIPWYT